jgi:hypothetical protein
MGGVYAIQVAAKGAAGRVREPWLEAHMVWLASKRRH